MPETGAQLLQAIRSMRNFLGDISELLRTADALMGERSWEPIWGASCLGDLSYSVSSGHKWMPREAWRPFKCPEIYPKVIATVSVLLDDFQREYKLVEPVVSGSYFIFPDVVSEASTKFDYWQTRCFGWCKAPLDGTPDSVDNYHAEWKSTYRWEHMHTFGQPLVDITTEEVLKDKVIDPLMALIENYCKDESKVQP